MHHERHVRIHLHPLDRKPPDVLELYLQRSFILRRRSPGAATKLRTAGNETKDVNFGERDVDGSHVTAEIPVAASTTSHTAWIPSMIG